MNEGCSQISDKSGNKSKYINTSIKTDSLNIPKDSTTFYIPIHFLSDTLEKWKADTFMDNWFSKMLYGLHEPLLYNRIEKKDIYRFTWLRSFHHPVSIRIEKCDNKVFLYTKETSGAGGYSPGKIIVDEKTEISEDKWDTFITKLNKVQFWEQPAFKQETGVDGAEWIMEGTTEDDYHVMIRWSEPSSDNFKECCKYLLGLSGLKFPKSEIY